MKINWSTLAFFAVLGYSLTGFYQPKLKAIAPTLLLLTATGEQIQLCGVVPSRNLSQEASASLMQQVLHRSTGRMKFHQERTQAGRTVGVLKLGTTDIAAAGVAVGALELAPEWCSNTGSLIAAKTQKLAGGYD